MSIGSTSRRGALALALMGMGVLELSPPDVHAQVEAPSSLPALSGRVVDASTGRPIPTALLRISGADISALSGPDGSYAFPELAAGSLTLSVSASGYPTLAYEVTLREGQPQVFTVKLRKGAAAEGDVVVISERREPPEPVVRKISVEEIQRIPGTFGDAVRVVQNLPGVARSPFGLGFLIVRGTEPDDTGTYVDGIRVPLIFHFGGLTAVINSDMLERVEFLPGGFGARYGRNLGGVVDVTTKEIRPTETSGYADIDLIDTTLFYSRPIGENGGLTASVRRSYVDAVVRPVLPFILDRFAPESDASFQLPVYEDYQLLYDAAIGDHHRLHVLLFGSRDRVSLSNGDPPASADPLIVEGGNAGLTVSNHKLLTRWTWVPNADFTNRVTLGLGPDGNEISVGAFSIKAKPFSIFLRDDFFWQVAPWLRVRGGLDVLAVVYNFSIELPFSLDATELDPLGEPDADSLTIDGFVASPSPWLEADVVFDDLVFTPGVRIDPYSVWEEGVDGQTYTATTVDPRLSMRWRFLPQATFKGSVGRFSNAPSPFAVTPSLGGDPTLRPEWALQSSAGFEYRFTDNISFDGSVYRGDLRELLATSGGDDERPVFVSTGAGVNQGLEFLLRHDPVDSGFFGWVSYTLQKAERTNNLELACPRTGDEPGEPGCEPWVLFDFDQTHILTLVASQKLPRGWEVGARFRLTTGTPYTPIVDSYYDVDDDGYVGLPGEQNSLRFPPFHQLDVRVDKRFDVKWGELAVALEVLNVYNRQNPEAVQYNFDYRQSRFVAGLPIFPAFGVKASF